MEWVTYSENTIHAFKTGLKIPEKGEQVHNASISDVTAHLICQMVEDGKGNKEILENIDVTPNVLQNIRSGKTWQHISRGYNLKPPPKSIDDSVVHWICQKMVEGYKNYEILAMCENDSVTKSTITKIRNKKQHSYISDQYF